MECKRRKFYVKHLGLIVLLEAINFFIYGQVENNSIHKRVELNLNSSIRSTTANSTVEWSCISKNLTNKCLVYHNDQWFSFTPQQTGTYFLNISSQQCKKNLGVQLIIIEGDPCLISSYKILNCIPKIMQSDVFVELSLLDAGKLYLINVDGFLGDFCEFHIQLSEKPNGLPWQFKSQDTLNIRSEVDQDIVKLSWHATQPQMDQLEHFEINRLKIGEHKFEVLGINLIRSNALGKHEEDYHFIDTLSHYGNYQYTIIGVYRDNGYRIILDEEIVAFKKEENLPKQFIARIPLSYRSKGKLDVKVINASTDEILTTINYDYVYPESLGVNLTKFVRQGVTRFWIKLKNIKTKEFHQFTFKVAQDELTLVEK